MTGDYLSELKTAVTGDPAAPLAFICNFEAENDWAVGHIGLPAAPFSGSARMVRRMEELGILLAGPRDLLILGQHLDPAFAAYVEGLGIRTASVAVPAPRDGEGEGVDSAARTTERTLADPDVLRRLAGFAATGGTLLPMGTTAAEAKLSAIAGIPLATPGPDVYERVNGKIFGRRLTRGCGLREVPGECCESVGELEAALDRARRIGETVVVKDSFGVSGKGLLVCDDDRRVDRLRQMVRRRANRTGDDRIEVVVERWLPKRDDLNYQITISRTGAVSLSFVKRAVTDRGVHLGHRMPAGLTAGQQAELVRAAEAIGAGLHAEGYWGVAGVDAVVGTDGTLYPVLEINARLNMSSYQGRVVERFAGPGSVALARHHRLRLTRPCSFERVRQALGALLDPGAPGRVVVTGFGTVNAQRDAAGQPYDGRLYVMAFADHERALDDLDADTADRLRAAGLTDQGA